MVAPIHQRKWKDILAVGYVDQKTLSFSGSKTMTQTLRHQGSHREDDCAMNWNTLLHMQCRDRERTEMNKSGLV